MIKLKILVVFYSRSDNTRRVGQEIKNKLDCDIEEVIDTQNRSGPLGYMRSVINAMRKTPAVLEEIKKDPSKYDLVIMGTPVWNMKMSTPMRTYITQNHTSFNNVAFFGTSMAAPLKGTFNEMTELCGKSPLAELEIRGKENYKPKLDEFVETINSITNI